jgi:type III restriction enzyme
MQSPILNNPYEEPKLHYSTDAKDGSLDYNNIRQGRRIFTTGSQTIPLKQIQGSLLEVNDAASDEDRRHIINLLRKEVGDWRKAGYPHVTRVSQTLLKYWFGNPEREVTQRLFFAQQEAVETAIWLNEIAPTTNPGNNILTQLADGRARGSAKDIVLPRTCFKMATGTGKTVVMACLILYHYLNRSEYRSDVRFADYFLIVAPGVTIRDRLSVLYVDESTKSIQEIKDYYRQRSLVPRQFNDILPGINQKLVLTNFHAFELKNLQGNKRSPFDGKSAGFNEAGKEVKITATENPALMIKRLMKSAKPGSRLLVINDEAHHCYYPKPAEKKDKGTKYKAGPETTAEEKAEVKEENERAALWYNGIVHLADKFKLTAVYDLSATPYFLNGSGYPAYALFPWIVSDFGLIEAIESGLVKIPFLPEKDNTHNLDGAKLANLYEHVKAELPKKGQRTKKKDAATEGTTLKESPPVVPELVKNAMDAFYSHYEKETSKVTDLLATPPVLIVVCNNTSVSKEVYKWMAGYEYESDNGETIRIPGHFELFSNYDRRTGQLLPKPPTLLIDSDALENSDQVGDDFKRIFAPEIEKFKREYRTTHPGKSVEAIADADILREVVNTVGKKGQLGAHIRCVVSVSMLTEGWDANTVTHIAGIRAFGSQLLCEQIAGRALRRKQYFLQGYDKDGLPISDKRKIVIEKFPPEYAHIIGVPFKMFKSGEAGGSGTPREVTHIEALPERQAEYEITFPNVTGYRIDVPADALSADFSKLENYELDGSRIPTRTVMFTAFKEEKDELTVEKVKAFREQSVIYAIVKELIAQKFPESKDPGKPEDFQITQFAQLKAIATEWYQTKVHCIGETFPQMLLYDNPKKITDHIYRGIMASQKDKAQILPVLNYHNPFGSTKHVHGNTTRPVFATEKSHVNYVVADTESWEQICAKTLEDLDEVESYVKNAFLGFAIPYTSGGREDRPYFPDFIAHCRRPDGSTLNLIIEITGMNTDKADKRDAVEHRWLPAVNAVREQYDMDEWAFIEVSQDIRDIRNQLRNAIQKATISSTQLAEN